jgi:hypothetical protein
MLMPDTNPEVADLLVDERARHYWDAKTRLGRYVAELLGEGDGTPAWDIYLVYGPDAMWGDEPKATGSPVISDSGGLEQALGPYLGSARRAASVAPPRP